MKNLVRKSATVAAERAILSRIAIRSAKRRPLVCGFVCTNLPFQTMVNITLDHFYAYFIFMQFCIDRNNKNEDQVSLYELGNKYPCRDYITNLSFLLLSTSLPLFRSRVNAIKTKQSKE